MKRKEIINVKRKRHEVEEDAEQEFSKGNMRSTRKESLVRR